MLFKNIVDIHEVGMVHLQLELRLLDELTTIGLGHFTGTPSRARDVGRCLIAREIVFQENSLMATLRLSIKGCSAR